VCSDVWLVPTCTLRSTLVVQLTLVTVNPARTTDSGISIPILFTEHAAFSSVPRAKTFHVKAFPSAREETPRVREVGGGSRMPLSVSPLDLTGKVTLKTTTRWLRNVQVGTTLHPSTRRQLRLVRPPQVCRDDGRRTTGGRLHNLTPADSDSLIAEGLEAANARASCAAGR